MSEDATVYEYDSIYDNMQSEKEKKDVKVKAKVDKKVRVILVTMETVLVYPGLFSV